MFLSLDLNLSFSYLDGFDGWLPLIELVYTHDAGKDPAPKTIHQLASCLRMAFCESVCLDLSEWYGEYQDSETLIDFCGMVFDDLLAPNTFVDTLTVRMNWCNTAMALRKSRKISKVSRARRKAGIGFR